MIFRCLVRDDEAAALVVWNRAALYDPMSLDLFRQKVWEDPDFNDNLAVAAEIDGQLVGFAVGVLRASDEEARGYIKLLAVDPAHQAHSIGEQLLQQIEDGLIQLGAREIRVAESAPNYLIPGIDRRDTDSLDFFEHHGYERFAEARNLRVVLGDQDWDSEEDRHRLDLHKIHIRRARPSDQASLFAFLDIHWSSWKFETSRTFSNKPISLHIALFDRDVIGFAAYHGNNVGTGWFGPMGTDPAYQRLGVGSVLLRRCLQDLKRQGFETATIPWAAHIDFYRRHADARVDRVFYRYRKMCST
ncbi:MAG: GNAT family N-acetyltransferase [Pirellulales bacterium]|nr:GNAT family N-acetyltransferase [Pirellulales bacterium]